MAKQDYNYFDEFISLSKFSLSCANILKETLQNFNPDVMPKKIVEMHNLEHSADIAKHNMMNRLAKEFVPPIEREDIISLSQRIDDVTDTVEDILIKIDIYNLKTIRPELLEFTSLVLTSCENLCDALVEFKHFKKSETIHSKIIEINRLEEEGDKLYTSTVRNLYRSTSNAVDLLVLSEILNRFEKCCDACEAAANTIESVIMKNS